MKVGTMSLLFGVHQFIWHPITVYLAWRKLYGKPDFKTVICIIIHDWGYWGKPNMDGKEGEKHPEYAALLAFKWFGFKYYWLCLYHSRHYARINGENPSKLCWADKLSFLYEPRWFYLLRSRLSGELKEYRKMAHNAGMVDICSSDTTWFDYTRARMKEMGENQNNTVPFINPVRN